LVELARLIKKYPGGATDRWETIAESMNRNVSEVTFMANKLKENAHQTPSETEKLVDFVNKEIMKKNKKKSKDVQDSVASDNLWTQVQQKVSIKNKCYC
jgi:DnaJ homolog subfamily C member 1